MKKYIIFVLFFLLSGIIFAHDYKWGESISELIRTIGEPKYINERRDITVLSYEPIEDIIDKYVFTKDGLILVQRIMGPYLKNGKGLSSIDWGLVEFETRLNRFNKIYKFESIDEDNSLVIFKYGSDTISVKFVTDGETAYIRIFFYSALGYRLFFKEFLDM